MKRFRCGDVVPGCSAEFIGTEEEIVTELAHHAQIEHDLAELPPEMVEAVRERVEPA